MNNRDIKWHYICEDSLDGIFSGVYSIYKDKKASCNTNLITEIENYELFSEYISVKTNLLHSEKVANTIRKLLGIETYHQICRVACSYESDKADVIFHTIKKGLSLKYGCDVLLCIHDEAIQRVFEINRTVNNEVLHLHGFLRFQELKKGILFAGIEPKNDILLLLAPHFADRFPLENFIIYDKKRKSAIMHKQKSVWAYCREAVISDDFSLEQSEQEVYFQQMFRQFCKSISIKERENISLQKQMLPLRFRPDMIEFY